MLNQVRLGSGGLLVFLEPRRDRLWRATWTSAEGICQHQGIARHAIQLVVDHATAKDKDRKFNGGLQPVLLRRTGRPVIGWSARGREEAPVALESPGRYLGQFSPLRSRVKGSEHSRLSDAAGLVCISHHWP